jgi:hypothetical protein
MQKTILAKISGIAPLVMHNITAADRFSKIAREMKDLTGKSKKTDADFERMAQVEFVGGLYVDANGEPILPSYVLEAVIIEGAKLNKDGPRAKAGVICEDASLIYDGPRTARELWERRDEFSLRTFVRVKASRVMRVRPMFRGWSADVTTHIDSTIVDVDTVRDWIEAAGRSKGIGDWRPKYGRFSVLSVSETTQPLPKAA